MKKLQLLFLTACLCFASLALSSAEAKAYSYLAPSEVKSNLENGSPMVLVDIQTEEAFAAHHLPGAVETRAYPVKSGADKARLGAALPLLKAGKAPVVIVCPRGGGGAKRAYSHLKKQGVEEARLFILKNGQDGWPYESLTVKSR